MEFNQQELYEVTASDYTNFIRTLKRGTYKVEPTEVGKIIRHKITGTPLAEQNNETHKVYIYNFPPDEDRVAPVPVRRLHLNTREEVQAFFDALSKMYKEGQKHHDGTVS